MTFFELDDGCGHAVIGHKWNLKVKRNRLQLRKCLIFSWNRLPGNVVDARSLNSFKKRLDE